MLRAVFRFLTGGILDRVLETVDRRVEAQTDREKIKGEIIKEHYRTRADWMRSGDGVDASLPDGIAMCQA